MGAFVSDLVDKLLSQVTEAETRIANGERLHARLVGLVAKIRALGGDATRAEASILAMEDVLATFREHRAALLRTVADVELRIRET